MSSMGSMDSIFDAFDNSSVGDLLDIQNSVAFLSRVFGKRLPKHRTVWFGVFLDDPSLTMAEHKMEQKLKDMGWNLTLCEERDRLKFNEIGPELRFLSSFLTSYSMRLWRISISRRTLVQFWKIRQNRTESAGLSEPQLGGNRSEGVLRNCITASHYF